MREIKFRAWDTNEKNMKQEAYCETSPSTLNKYIKVTQEEGIIYMQFTGLHDRNGLEIYESDIVSLSQNGKTKIREIVFRDAAFGIYEDIGKEYPLFVPIGQLPKAEKEILGNIYSNPDLLPLDKQK